MKKLARKVKDLYEAATDGSKGSIVDVIKVTIRLFIEFTRAVRSRLNQSLKNLTDNSDTFEAIERPAKTSEAGDK